jgi:hypothetical protein
LDLSLGALLGPLVVAANIDADGDTSRGWCCHSDGPNHISFMFLKILVNTTKNG